jgi:integrase
VLSDDDLRALLATCAGRDFVDLRDTALLRLFIATGGRRAEVAGLTVDALELDTDTVRLFGKGRRERQVALSPRPRRRSSGTSARGADTAAQTCPSCGWGERNRGRWATPASRRC